MAASPHRHLLRTASRTAFGAALAGVVAVPLGCAAPGGDSVTTEREASEVAVRAGWDDGVATAAEGGLVRGRVDLVTGTERVVVALRNGRPVAIPRPCVQSNVRRVSSYIDDRTLVCVLGGAPDSLSFTAIVEGTEGSRLGGEVVTTAGGDERRESLPERVVLGGAPAEPDLRLVSSPDFLNADVADLSRGPGRWSPARSANGTSPAYEEALGGVLDDWAALDPAAVLVAGDVVNGRWGFDDQRTGTFGPVRTLAQRKAALRRAARTYYPQWRQRFEDRGLAVFPSVGDHEFGDNPFSPGKRRLAPTARREFARAFTTNPDGSPRYDDRPRGPARLTAFAGRPSPDLQIVSLDVFDITPRRARIRVDPRQLRWLEGVLARARRDRVKWVIVESHVPIAFPVRNRASSALRYEGGTDSPLWRLMRRYDVDLYLSGEVHDSQLVARDGIVQVSHGGAFQYGLTTALVLDFYGDNLYLTLRDYDVRTDDRGGRLWETRRAGLPADISTGRRPVVIGTASVGERGLVDASGILTPVRR